MSVTRCTCQGCALAMWMLQNPVIYVNEAGGDMTPFLQAVTNQWRKI